ncbi:HET-domain-containing protein, partial [Acephala macrosclerotiorum]
MTRAFSSVKPLGTVNPRPPLGIAVDARWIQPRLLQRWKRSCDSQEGQRCQQTLAHVLTGSPPAWLIDTWLLRLVPGGLCTPYVALSYVWGVTPFFHTSESTLASLQKDYGLRDRPGVPQTILDAISVTQLLGERYLWVDSLCIIQDNDKMKQTEINNMGSIFGNATITITAQQGADANYGLRGLHGISSQPRSTSQEIFRLSRKHHFMRECLFIDKLSDFDTVWMSRGWTFQEEIFSRRILVFHNDRIWWKCTCSSFTEDTRPNPRNPEHNPERYGMQSIRRLFSSTLPDFEGYKDLVRTYNSKEFTNPEDAPAAFAGIMTVLAQSFHKGFICGLPALFFNIALCWQPEGPCTRRRPRNDSPASRSKLPSWSWLGW